MILLNVNVVFVLNNLISVVGESMANIWDRYEVAQDRIKELEAENSKLIAENMRHCSDYLELTGKLIEAEDILTMRRIKMNDSIECKCCLRIKQLENMIGQYELHKKLYEQEYEILHKRYEDNKWLSKRLHDSDGKLILKLQKKLKLAIKLLDAVKTNGLQIYCEDIDGENWFDLADTLTMNKE